MQPAPDPDWYELPDIQALFPRAEPPIVGFVLTLAERRYLVLGNLREAAGRKHLWITQIWEASDNDDNEGLVERPADDPIYPDLIEVIGKKIRLDPQSPKSYLVEPPTFDLDGS